MKHVTERLLKVCSAATFVNSEKPKIDPTAVFNLTYGLFVLTSKDGDKDSGCIANTAFQVANEPTRLAISVQMENLTREVIEKTGEFNVSVLADTVPFDTIKHFGMQSGRDTDKFATFTDTETAANGIKYVTKDTITFFSCKVKEKLNLGSHMMFVGEVTEAQNLSKANPCTYAYYHKAIKPKF